MCFLRWEHQRPATAQHTTKWGGALWDWGTRGTHIVGDERRFRGAHAKCGETQLCSTAGCKIPISPFPIPTPLLPSIYYCFYFTLCFFKRWNVCWCQIFPLNKNKNKNILIFLKNKIKIDSGWWWRADPTHSQDRRRRKCWLMFKWRETLKKEIKYLNKAYF